MVRDRKKYQKTQQFLHEKTVSIANLQKAEQTKQWAKRPMTNSQSRQMQWKSQPNKLLAKSEKKEQLGIHSM